MEMTDVVVIVSSQHFNAHKKILQAHSGYFKVILENTNKAILQCISSYAFSVLLEYMYTSNLRVSYLNVYELIFSAQFLQMDRASSICKSFLTCSDAILNTYPAASRHHMLYGETKASSAVGSASHDKASDNIIKPIAKNLTSSVILQNMLQQRLNDYCRQKMFSNVMGAFSPFKGSTSYTAKENSTVQKKKCERRNENHCQLLEETSITLKNKGGTLDIARCDGPVKFHKVLNENYIGNSETKNLTEQENTAEARKFSSNKIFSCVYCKISFKSHYCYQKHKRRHINPISDKLKNPHEKTVKPAEINVPFYPCKSCGSKFPSYYFVHKHKKVCLVLQNGGK